MGPSASVDQQVAELFGDFSQNVATNEDAFMQFMYWAAETDGVNLQDLLIATRSVYDIMDEELPCDKATWNEVVEMANLVEVSTVSESELEYALEVFSKTFDLYKAELRRLDEERSEAEQLSSQRISDEILAEDEGLFADVDQDELGSLASADSMAGLGRWDKVVDDTRSKINSTKAELDELVEELTPYRTERDTAISRMRVLDKDANRKRQRLERYQDGRISEAKAEEIRNLERELVTIEDQEADWSSRLAIAQERIDERLGLFREKRMEFYHIKVEVESLVGSLSSVDRAAVEDALEGELSDLDGIIEDVDSWIGGLTSESSDSSDDSTAILETPPTSIADEDVEARWTPPPIAGTVVKAAGAVQDGSDEEPPVVFMDSEVRRMLAELPIDRPPEEELILRIEGLQQELINRENMILELEHSIEQLMEDREGTTTAVELERNKIRLELAKVQDELTEKQGLLEQYLDVIKTLELQMEGKDRELRETLALNRRKTDELRQKETELEALEKELLERQEEHRQERQELQDREERLNTLVQERESQEREIAKKDLTLELRNEQIRKKMDRLTTRELEMQRVTSGQKELEEMLTLKERELQNLKGELDVREDELRRREVAIEERSMEAKKLQSEVSKLEHRVRSRDEALRRREAHSEEEEERIRRIEAAIAEREVQLQTTADEVNLREAKAEAALGSLEAQRDEVDRLRRETAAERQEIERLRIAQEQRHEQFMRREDALGAREATLRERERATELREERISLERADLEANRKEFDDVQVKWSAREKNLLEQLETFNSEKQELVGDWKSAKRRVRQLEREKADLTARLIAAESSLMNKGAEILTIARELEDAKGSKEGGAVLEFDDGTKTSLKRIMEDIERQHEELDELNARASKVEERERELIEMEEILNNERERVRELVTEQEKGRADLQETLEQLAERTSELEDAEMALKDQQSSMKTQEADILHREEEVREREREMERLTTAEHAEARAEDREEELADLQRQLEERTSALEFREEELERSRSRMEREKEELDRQKRDLMLARENLLRAGEELEEIPAAELTEERIARAPSGLAKRAADMLAAADVEEMDMEDGDGDEEGAAEGRPLARLRCKVCSTIIPIHTEARPLDIVCPSCGKEGILK